MAKKFIQNYYINEESCTSLERKEKYISHILETVTTHYTEYNGGKWVFAKKNRYQKYILINTWWCYNS